jgi:hypothetical protein
MRYSGGSLSHFHEFVAAFGHTALTTSFDGVGTAFEDRIGDAASVRVTALDESSLPGIT